jgi:hypothetical protein
VNDDTKFAKAHQAIGEYFSAFSELERELGESVKVVLHLEDHPAADLVVDLLRFAGTKARLVKDAAEIATKKRDRSRISTEWKERANKTLGDILSHNEACRDYLAHSHLEPQEDGSVKVTRRNKGKSQNWKLQPKIDEVQRLTKELREIRTELSKLDVHIGSLPIEWALSTPVYAGGGAPVITNLKATTRVGRQ